MAYVNFTIPGNKADLLKSSAGDEYMVKNVSIQKELSSDLKNAKTLLREEGAEFILETFDVYYSVLHHGETVSMDVAYRAYEDLHKGAVELNKAIGFLLEDKESLNEEVKMKYVNILKMHLYIYTQIVLLIEQRNTAKNEQLVKGRKKNSKSVDDDFVVDKKSVLLLLNNIMQREISLFWESQVVEENLINVVSGTCYEFLQNPSIKKEKEEFTEIFNVLGYLLKVYNHGTTFVVRITQLVKLYDHLVQCLPKGIQQLVQGFNYKSLLHELVEELTEWQTDDRHQDNQGARHCATVLSSLAALMPDLMMPEVVSLNSYLFHDPPSLRTSVIMVMVEVILNNLSSHLLNDEQKQFRDELFTILIEHIEDNAALVRAKVFQQCARLQNESAIPLKFQQDILEKVVEHLCDKGAVARKSAANCLTTFLSFNAFSANLHLSEIKKELESNKELLKNAKEQFKDPKVEKLLELQLQWDKNVGILKDVVINELEKEKENEDNDEEKENRIPTEQIPDVIRMYLQDEKFIEAFQVCRQAMKDTEFLKKFTETEPSEESDAGLYMTVLYTTFFDVTKVIEQMKNQEFVNVTEEDYKKMEALAKNVQFLEDCVNFLNTIDKAIDTMIELLDTTSTSDMHEAIEFFVAAYKFNIDRVSDGILAMLRLMQRNEQERKDAVIEAFRTIYLVSEASNMSDHCNTIVNRLIKLVKTVPATNIDDLQEIIANWCSQGTLDNAVIEMLWQYTTQRVSVTEEDECAAFELLRMASVGRKTIISRNVNLVMNIGFGDRGRKNMSLLGVCCNLLSVAFEKVEINNKTSPFKIKAEDPFFKELVDILSEQFFKPVKFYYKALYGAIDFIYKMCAKPETVCEALLSSIIPKLAKKQKEEPNAIVPDWALIRLCQMSGYIAIKHLIFLDDTTYKELKRRQNIRDERKREKTSTKKGKKNKEKNKDGIRKSIAAGTASEASTMMMSVAMDDSILEGAQAEDMDAEFILNVLENDTVTGSGFLVKLAPLIIHICERPDLFKTQEIQFAAVTALMRLMLVSSRFCETHIRLVFTIFEKTTYSDIKSNILIHVSDLLSRFPNVIEPWTPRIFQSLKDPLPQTRKATFFSLSNLILRDMIRAHSHIPEMASCLADEDSGMRAMSKTFFAKLSHKENNLYNALPDIFTHVMAQENVDDDGVKNTMSLLFDLIENAKHMEHIVSRFCSKFKMTEDTRHHKNISYCLTLIKYNDKALKKLIDEFGTYKHILHDADVYANFRTIMQNCNKGQAGKADLKPIVTELENMIKSVFELNENGMLPPPPPKSAKKRTKPKKKAPAARRKRRHEEDSDDSE